MSVTPTPSESAGGVDRRILNSRWRLPVERFRRSTLVGLALFARSRWTRKWWRRFERAVDRLVRRA